MNLILYDILNFASMLEFVEVMGLILAANCGNRGFCWTAVSLIIHLITVIASCLSGIILCDTDVKLFHPMNSIQHA